MNRFNRPIIIGTLVLSLFTTTSNVIGDAGHGPKWDYDGKEGPDHWGELDPAFEVCKNGKNQSPIDITGKGEAALDPIEFNYQPAPLSIVNNGHTIQVNLPKGSTITTGGKKYDLLQFHFHNPSEHKAEGKASEMEVHFVHKNAEGGLAVVGVFMNKGKENAAIKNIWGHLPAKAGKEQQVKDVKVNPADLLPANKAYVNYPGSLTTPPCSEGVNWHVMKEPIEVSEEQIKKFGTIIKESARPVQPLNGRAVKASK